MKYKAHFLVLIVLVVGYILLYPKYEIVNSNMATMRINKLTGQCWVIRVDTDYKTYTSYLTWVEVGNYKPLKLDLTPAKIDFQPINPNKVKTNSDEFGFVPLGKRGVPSE